MNTTIEKTYDVIVVGAGPAGSAAARMATSRGLSVLMIEKKTLPREKPCSGLLLSYSINIVRKYFGEPPESVFAAPGSYRALRMHFQSGRYFDMPLDSWMVWRKPFDYWLNEQSGAEIMDNTKVVSFKEDVDGVTVICRNNATAGQKEFRCRVMIGADGGFSSIAHMIDPARRDRIQWFSALQSYYTGDINLEPGLFHFFVIPGLESEYPAVYQKDNMWIVDVGVPKGASALPAEKSMMAFLEKEYDFKPVKMVKRRGCMTAMIPIHNELHFGTNRILLVGEACGLMNMMMEGISSALASGIIAGESASEAIKQNKPPGELYARRIQPEVRRTMKQLGIGALLSGTFGEVKIMNGLKGLNFRQKILAMADLIRWGRELIKKKQELQKFSVM